MDAVTVCGKGKGKRRATHVRREGKGNESENCGGFVEIKQACFRGCRWSDMGLLLGQQNAQRADNANMATSWMGG